MRRDSHPKQIWLVTLGDDTREPGRVLSLDPAWVSATLDRITRRCAQCAGQQKEDAPMPSPPIVYRGHTIGARQPWGNTLNKHALRQLRPVDRLRAYLWLVYPAPRRPRLLARACGVKLSDVSNLLKASRKAGQVRRLPSGQGYVAVLGGAGTTPPLRLVTARTGASI